MSKKEIAERLHYKMSSEGLGYYFLSYGPDYDSFKKLGFDVDKIKEAVKSLEYLESIQNKLEEMSEEE